jgi:hypothetical protein
MANLTKTQRAILESALRNAERAMAFIQAPHIAVARMGTLATTTLHYTRADGATLYPIAKDIGSDLTGLDNCIQSLRRLLAPPVVAPIADPCKTHEGFHVYAACPVCAHQYCPNTWPECPSCVERVARAIAKVA